MLKIKSRDALSQEIFSSHEKMKTEPNDWAWKNYAIILVFCGTLFWLELGATKLWDDDEGYFVSVAYEMYSNSQWIVPTFNSKMFGHKPPWMYWMMILSFRCFGVSEFAARFPTTIFSILTVILTFRLGQLFYGRTVGMYSALILTTCLMFNVVSRAATPDAYLVFFTTLAMYLFARFVEPKLHRNGDQISGATQNWNNLAAWISVYISLSIAVLVKGPIGILLPMSVIGLYGLCTYRVCDLSNTESPWLRVLKRLRLFSPKNFFSTIFRMKPFVALTVVILVACPWYCVAGYMTNGNFLYEFFVIHHFERTTTVMENHAGSLFYYPVSILIGMFPWSIFTVPAFVIIRRTFKHSEPSIRLPITFLLCWVFVYVGLFSLASTKLPNYVLPAYPALALLIGFYLKELSNNQTPRKLDTNLFRLARASMAVVGVTIIAGLFLIVSIQTNEQTVLDAENIPRNLQVLIGRMAILGIPFLVWGLGAFDPSHYLHVPGKFISFMIATTCFYAFSWGAVAPRLEKFQTIQATTELLSSKQQPFQLATYRVFRPSMVFYSRRKVSKLNTTSELSNWIDPERKNYLPVKREQAKELIQNHPDFKERANVRGFPKFINLVWLERNPSTP